MRQIEEFLKQNNVKELALVVASSIGADLATYFISKTQLPVKHAFFDGGQFAKIGKFTRRIMTPFIYFAIKSIYKSNGKNLGKIMWCDDEEIRKYFVDAGKALTYGNMCAGSFPTALKMRRSRLLKKNCKGIRSLSSGVSKNTINIAKA